MARHSEVQIQGTNVPGLIMKVTVPVDHYVAPDTARGIYNYPDADYIWLRSWDTDQPAKSGSPSPRQASSDGSFGIGDLFKLGWCLGGVVVYSTAIVAHTAWDVSKWAAPKVWKGYMKAIQGTEWVLANTR